MNKQEVFAAVIEKYRDTTDSHLDNMSIDELCEHRQKVSRQLKSLEDERKLIDESLMESLSEVELKTGIYLKSGACLKLRSRTSYKYPDDVVEEISSLRRYSRDTGAAESETTTFLVLL